MTDHIRALRRIAPAAVAALLCAGLLAGCGDSEPTTKNADANLTPSTTATAPTSDATSPAASTSTSATGGSDVDVYFVAKTSMGDRLVAEPSTVGADPLTGALQTVMAGSATDPDYRSLVPADSLKPTVSFDGTGDSGTIEVTVAASKWAKAPAGMTPATARLALQQLAYTLNAAAGTTKAEVHFTDGTADSTYLGQPASVKPASQLRTLSLMNVLSPADGSRIAAGKTVFSGVGSSYEATVGWSVQDSAGRTVLKGSTMAEGWMDKLYPWKKTVDLSKLSPGTYTFTASTDDPSGGEGGGPVTDTKTFTLG